MVLVLRWGASNVTGCSRFRWWGQALAGSRLFTVEEDLDAVADRQADSRKKSRADYLRTKAESQVDPRTLKTS